MATNDSGKSSSTDLAIPVTLMLASKIIVSYIINRDISFYLIILIAILCFFLMVNTWISGLYSIALSMASKSQIYSLHWVTAIVPLGSIPLAYIWDRETEIVWRQIKLCAIAMPLIGFMGYWAYTIFMLNIEFGLNKS